MTIDAAAAVAAVESAAAAAAAVAVAAEHVAAAEAAATPSKPDTVINGSPQKVQTDTEPNGVAAVTTSVEGGTPSAVQSLASGGIVGDIAEKSSTIISAGLEISSDDKMRSEVSKAAVAKARAFIAASRTPGVKIPGAKPSRSGSRKPAASADPGEAPKKSRSGTRSKPVAAAAGSGTEPQKKSRSGTRRKPVAAPAAGVVPSAEPPKKSRSGTRRPPVDNKAANPAATPKRASGKRKPKALLDSNIANSAAAEKNAVAAVTAAAAPAGDAPPVKKSRSGSRPPSKLQVAAAAALAARAMAKRKTRSGSRKPTTAVVVAEETAEAAPKKRASGKHKPKPKLTQENLAVQTAATLNAQQQAVAAVNTVAAAAVKTAEIALVQRNAPMPLEGEPPPKKSRSGTRKPSLAQQLAAAQIAAIEVGSQMQTNPAWMKAQVLNPNGSVRKVLVIYSGGAIGLVKGVDGLSKASPGALGKKTVEARGVERQSPANLHACGVLSAHRLSGYDATGLESHGQGHR